MLWHESDSMGISILRLLYDKYIPVKPLRTAKNSKYPHMEVTVNIAYVGEDHEFFIRWK